MRIWLYTGVLIFCFRIFIMHFPPDAAISPFIEKDSIMSPPTRKTHFVPLIFVVAGLAACGGSSGGSGATPDTTAPSTPGSLAVGTKTASTLALSWVASTDDVGVDHYELLKDGVVVGTSNTTGFVFSNLAAATSYQLSVAALDAAGNRSVISTAIAGLTEVAIAGVPTINAATLSTNTVSVSGSDFGVKPTAAPLRFDDFDDKTTGASPADIGYHNYGGFGGAVSVDNSTSYSGGKSLKHQSNFGPADAGGTLMESFPHIAVNGFSSTELYLSYRLKFKTNGSRIVQLKFNRSGMEVDGVNGSPCYGGYPKFRESYYPDGPSNALSQDKTLYSVQGGVLSDDVNSVDKILTEGWVGDGPRYAGTVIPITEDTWVQVEAYAKLNDIGVPNGEYVTYLNGHRQFNLSDMLIRSSADKVLNCSYLIIGIDYWLTPSSTNGVTVWYDDHYLDTSRARLVLANAATWDQATIRSPQPATAWSTGLISAQLKRGGLAAGDAWLYVVRADGTVSEGWKVTLN